MYCHRKGKIFPEISFLVSPPANRNAQNNFAHISPSTPLICKIFLSVHQCFPLVDAVMMCLASSNPSYSWFDGPKAKCYASCWNQLIRTVPGIVTGLHRVLCPHLGLPGTLLFCTLKFNISVPCCHLQPSPGAAQEEKTRRAKCADFCACIRYKFVLTLPWSGTSQCSSPQVESSPCRGAVQFSTLH